MKLLIFGSALLMILFSCKKEITQERDNSILLSNVRSQLMESLSLTDLQQLDFNNAALTNNKQNDLTILKIPFINKNTDPEFLLLKIEKNQFFSTGKIIRISGNMSAGTPNTFLKFNGRIKIYSLERKLLTESPITNGNVEEFHSNENSGMFVVNVAEIPLMPEVVVIASYPPSGNSSWYYSYWFNYQSMLFQGDNSMGGGGGWGLGGGSGGSGVPNSGNPINIDFEPVESLAAIDLKKYIQCFKNIPDAGATCSISIYTDLPVDQDPNAFFDWENGSPGHTFLQISKSNGRQRVQQNIGFYPIKGWKNALTTAPEDGKFVDNSGHEFNASITMNLTPDQLQSTLIHMQSLANFIKYDIDDYNCTDFALDVFNYKRGGNQLEVPRYPIPGGSAPFGTATPQGLYQKLKAMKNQSTTESANITIPGVKGYAGNSQGPCN